MEWKNDILSFSGFEYGARNDNKIKKAQFIESDGEEAAKSDDSEDDQVMEEEKRKNRNLRDFYLHSKSSEAHESSSLSSKIESPFPKKEQLSIEKMVENGVETISERELATGIEEMVLREEKNDCYWKYEHKIDSMTERRIENQYFWNIEQAERKLNNIVVLKSKMNKLRERGEIIDRGCLKPRNHENPWKFRGSEQQDWKKNAEAGKSSSFCVIC